MRIVKICFLVCILSVHNISIKSVVRKCNTTQIFKIVVESLTIFYYENIYTKITFLALFFSNAFIHSPSSRLHIFGFIILSSEVLDFIASVLYVNMIWLTSLEKNRSIPATDTGIINNVLYVKEAFGNGFWKTIINWNTSSNFVNILGISCLRIFYSEINSAVLISCCSPFFREISNSKQHFVRSFSLVLLYLLLHNSLFY